MTPEEAREAICDVLTDIAPEVDPATIDDRIDLTEQLDLDSMDYLTWMIGISETTGIEIPQKDVSCFLSLEGAVNYLVEHAVQA